MCNSNGLSGFAFERFVEGVHTSFDIAIVASFCFCQLSMKKNILIQKLTKHKNPGSYIPTDNSLLRLNFTY